MDSSEWGPGVWQQLHATVESIPCPDCRVFGVKAMHALHDAVNLKLGKPVKYPEDLQFFQKKLAEATRRCHHTHQCSKSLPQHLSAACKRRIERCVQAVKEKGEARNPWAVCKASVKC